MNYVFAPPPLQKKWRKWLKPCFSSHKICWILRVAPRLGGCRFPEIPQGNLPTGTLLPGRSGLFSSCSYASAPFSSVTTFLIRQLHNSVYIVMKFEASAVTYFGWICACWRRYAILSIYLACVLYMWALRNFLNTAATQTLLTSLSSFYPLFENHKWQWRRWLEDKLHLTSSQWAQGTASLTVETPTYLKDAL